MTETNPPPTPAETYFRQRHAVAKSSARLLALRDAIADPVNLSSFQWAQWFAYVRDYRPDLVLELGRRKGNSTAAITQALRENGHGKLVSFDLGKLWEGSRKLLRPLVEPDWFEPIEARIQDLCDADFEPILEGSNRVLVLWDAHGFAVAEVVLATIMPLLQDREHVVIMHDVSDQRYCGSPREYGMAGIWQGREWAELYGHSDCRLQLGWINTVVDQPIVALDFLGRNRTELESADHSYHREIAADPERAEEMARVLEERDLSMVADWAWFTLNGVPGPYTFPRRLPTASSPRVVLRPHPRRRAVRSASSRVQRVLGALRSRLGRSLGF